MAGVVIVKGGIPKHLNDSTGVASTRQHFAVDARMPLNHLWFKNTGGGPLTLTLTTQEDADASIGITLAAGDVWEGPAEISSFFTRAAADQTFEAVLFHRRG